MVKNITNKDFVKKRVLINGIEADASIPIKSLSKWKNYIIGE